jgi:hypothetical protein
MQPPQDVGMHISLVNDNDDNDDGLYLRLQRGKEFHNLVYMSHIKHINPAKRHK